MAANQDHLSFQWNTNSNRFTTTAAAIKEEEGSSLSSSTTTTSSDPFPRFTDMLITTNSPSSATTVDDTSSSSSSAVNSSSTFGYHGQYQFLPFNPSFPNYGSGTSSSSMIYPSINVASLNQTDVNLQASLDQNLLFGALLTDHHHQTVNPYPGADHPMPQYCSPTTKVSSSEMITDKGKVATESDEREVKRCNSSRSVTQLQGSGANKKSKVDQQTRASCPPFKVRKEKLGDRITALQQLVAPFGKTDTASVLMEAIGYINFLQNQVETLSVPYMKSTRNKPPQSMHFQSAEGGAGEVATRDLRSRGLCLVPLSCTSYITNMDTGASGSYSGAMWPPPPPHFGQGTYNL
ncbi:Transcription factor bHLH110 [Linum grandiflorum]